MTVKFLSRGISLYKPTFHTVIKQFRTATVKQSQWTSTKSKFTSTLQFVNAESYEPIPTYSILNAPDSEQAMTDAKLDKQVLLKMYRDMVTVREMDKVLYESQRQGRISFYMTNTGEEAVQIGSAAALTLEDVIYAQYREAGVLLWRGFKVSEFMNQCYGNCDDAGKGKQMPVHYGSKELNCITISSPLTTQLPQAVGAAYALKRAKSKVCVAVYFGDGAASEGDAHAAFNFASTLSCPIVFVCRNNGYAISTPTNEQYGGDGIAAKGPAYGINTIRVDGNDVLAMYRVMRAARNLSVNEGRPVLIEAMTYRIGHHSTSDDSTTYRSADEIARWTAETPIPKFRSYLEKLDMWSEDREIDLVDSVKKSVLLAFGEAEKKLKPDWRELFTDVYRDMPDHIRKQMGSMEQHLKEYKEHYPLSSFKST